MAADIPHSGAEGESHHPPGAPRGRYLLLLSLTTLGVVYGDIGTSPLYTIREAFLPEHGVPVTRENVLGVLSLVFWALIIIVSIKYLVFVLRADNRGEGGILALTALVAPLTTPRRGRWALIMFGLFGTALLYGDGMITPAISVLSAVEGLKIATPLFEPYVDPITIVILVGLFVFQRHGTAKVGRIFGPVMIAWFTVMATLGARHIVDEPGVFAAMNPLHAVLFFAHNRWSAFLVLGSVFLAVTGGEALYADMGHFGKRPIRLAWFGLVLPALILNYFGQGALLIKEPEAIESPFYRMAPGWALLPIVALATAAAIIASQALISGAFSLTMQAVQLGYAPRVGIEHTSEKEMGQIYIPGINWTLMLACIGLVLGFRSSSNLAAAYGLAVTMTMVITTILFCVVARERWKWRLPAVLAVGGTFLTIDSAFCAANVLKIPHGGWFPLLIGAIVFALLTTWKKGRQILGQRINQKTVPRDVFMKEIEAFGPARVPGTAVFMSSNPKGTPPALVHNLRHNKVLHERVVFLSVVTLEMPYVPAADRVRVNHVTDGLYEVSLRYGFMEDVDVPAALAGIDAEGLRIDPAETTYFLGRETLLATANPGMAIWRERLFAVMSRNARNAASFFRLPPDRVVELGVQIEM